MDPDDEFEGDVLIRTNMWLAGDDDPVGTRLVDERDLDAALAAVPALSIDDSSEEGKRYSLLRRMRHDPVGTIIKAKDLVSTAESVDRLDILRAAAPHCAEPLGVLERAAFRSFTTGEPIRVPPMLLLGPPGTGKSWLASRVADALNTPMTKIDGAVVADRSEITGRSLAWRNPGIGRVAQALIDAPTLSPLIMLDEIEKLRPFYLGDAPLEGLLGLCEPETARTYRDAYIDVPMRADGVIWVMTANDVTGMPAPLLDRLLVFEISPSRAQALGIVRRLVEEASPPRFRDHPPPDATLEPLVDVGTRRARIAIGLAIDIAIADGRRALLPSDIQGAVALLGGDRRRHRIGFMAER